MPPGPISFGFDKLRKFRCDLQTLEILGAEFARDVKNVYRRGRRVKGADPSTFELLGPYYARDAVRVFTFASWHRQTTVVEGADPGSFLAMGSEFGTDRNNLYYLGELSEGSKTNGETRVNSFIDQHPELTGYWWN